MQRFLRFVFVVLIAIVGKTEPASAQEIGAPATLIRVEDPVYEYITRLQRRGHMLSLNPTALPYTRGEIAGALSRVDSRRLSPREQAWYDTIVERVQVRDGGRNAARVGAEVRAGVRGSNTARLDPMRPSDDVWRAMQFASIIGYAGSGPWALQIGAGHDRAYTLDPEGVSPVRRLEARNENTYAGVSTRLFSLYIGRYSRHWGEAGQPGLFMSDNPRSFDALEFRIGGDRFSLRSIAGELDAMEADETYTGRAFREGSVRRYLTTHRIDWRPRNNIAVTVMESALYSGANSTWALKYLNPVQVFALAIDNQPKNEENKGLVGGNLWMQFGRLTMNGQLLIDDIDIMNESGEPVSVALAGRAVWATRGAWDVGLTAKLVTARTYNTHQTEGQYLYLNRGLATNFSDFVSAGFFADHYADGWLDGLRLTPRLDYLGNGTFDMRRPFPANEGDVDWILDGIPEHTFRISTEVYYMPTRYLWVAADPGVNFVRDQAHMRGNNVTRFIGTFSFGVRVPLSGDVPLTW